VRVVAPGAGILSTNLVAGQFGASYIGHLDRQGSACPLSEFRLRKPRGVVLEDERTKYEKDPDDDPLLALNHLYLSLMVAGIHSRLVPDRLPQTTVHG
jgi:hypothetical protein